MDIVEKIGRLLLYKCHFIKLINKFSIEKEYLNAINPRASNEEFLSKMWGKRVITALLLLIFVLIFDLINQNTDLSENVLENNHLIRQEEDRDVDLNVIVENGNKKWNEKISFNIKERELNKKEKEKLEKDVEEYLDKTILGKNMDYQNIKEDLFLPNTIPDTDISLKWTYDQDYISEDGKINNLGLKEDINTEIMVEAQYKNWMHEYNYPIIIRGKEFNEQQAIMGSIKKEIDNKLKESLTKEKVKLPEKVEDFKIRYSLEEENKNNLDLILIVSMLAVLPIYWHQKVKKDIEKRNQQMLLDYPEIISKIMLLLGAGLSFRMSIERITKDYDKRKNRGGKIRFAYEELSILLQEMKDGISEHIAIEKFGKRCKLIPYLRFSSLMSQNLKKGAEGIIGILEKESMDAMLERKNKVLQLGEIAGTKLLVPMVIMLVIVISLIMIPAFMSF